MTIVCDNCGKVICAQGHIAGGIWYRFSARTPMKSKNYEACCEECFKALLNERGIQTYPRTNKRSLRLSKVALVLSVISTVTAAIVLVIRIAAVLL